MIAPPITPPITPSHSPAFFYVSDAIKIESSTDDSIIMGAWISFNAAVLSDIVGHIITLIPPEDGMSIIALSCVCVGWCELFPRWLQINGIVDVRGLAEDAEIYLCDRMHGTFTREMTSMHLRILESGVRAHVGRRATYCAWMTTCVCGFGRLLRWTDPIPMHGFCDSIAGVPVVVVMYIRSTEIGCGGGPPSETGLEIVVILRLSVKTVTFSFIPLRSDCYDRQGWRRVSLAKIFRPTDDETHDMETVRETDLDKFLAPYHVLAVDIYNKQVLGSDRQ
jgi:hypothetical protein